MALVTIILTTLNSQKFLARSIESCLQQTHTDLELLIVDGGSTDCTLEIVDSYTDPRFRLIHQPDNSGKLPGAINLGMENAKGEYITWTQDDSWYELDAIKRMLSYLQDRPNVALVYTDFWVVDESSTKMDYRVAVKPEYESIIASDVIGQCFLFKRKIYEEIGPQNVNYFPIHEAIWRIKIAEKYTIEELNVPLLFYTYHSQSLTGQIGRWELMRMRTKILLETDYIDKVAYRHKLAKIDVDQAYEEYILNGNYKAFWACFLSGIRHSLYWLTNIGLWKLVIFSFPPLRNRYRLKMLEEWRAEKTKQQNRLM